MLHKVSVIWLPGTVTSGRAKEEACRDCELCLPEGCSAMFLGETTGVSYKRRCAETSKNALCWTWRVEGEKPESQLESSEAEQTAVVQRMVAKNGSCRRLGEVRAVLFVHRPPSVCPGTERDRGGRGYPPRPLPASNSCWLQPCSPPWQQSMLKNKNTVSHMPLFTLTPLCNNWAFSFFSFFCLTNYFSTFKTWQRFQKLSAPSYRL